MGPCGMVWVVLCKENQYHGRLYGIVLGRMVEESVILRGKRRAGAIASQWKPAHWSTQRPLPGSDEEGWGALSTWGGLRFWERHSALDQSACGRPSALSAPFLPPTHSLLPPIKHHLSLLAVQTINGCNFNLKLTMVLSDIIMDKCKIQPISSESRSSVNTKYWLWGQIGRVLIRKSEREIIFP